MLLCCSRPHGCPSRICLRRKPGLTLLLVLTLGSTWQRADAQQKQACNLSQFQGNVSSIGPAYPASSCKTCVFPSWSDVSLDTTSILQLDLTGKWLYMLGDSTTQQLHEELLSYLDEPLVSLNHGISHLAKDLFEGASQACALLSKHPMYLKIDKLHPSAAQQGPLNPASRHMHHNALLHMHALC